jgi:hypothetical protein
MALVFLPKKNCHHQYSRMCLANAVRKSAMAILEYSKLNVLAHQKG